VKLLLSVTWVMSMGVWSVAADVRSSSGWMLLAGLALLPLLFLLPSRRDAVQAPPRGRTTGRYLETLVAGHAEEGDRERSPWRSSGLRLITVVACGLGLWLVIRLL
jgi:hypothetical protein